MIHGVRFLVGLCAVAAAGCGQTAPEETVSETVVPVTTQAAGRGTIRGVVHATGLVAPAPGADLIVVAPQAARVAEIPKAEGDLVRRGDLLVRFDVPAIAADVASRRAEVARALARLENARANRARAHDLFDRGVAARKDVEDADRELADAEAGLVEARAASAAADEVSTRAAIHATFDGVVARRSHNPGDVVEPTAADAVLRVIDPRRLEIIASVPIADVSRVAVGASAHVSGAPDGTPLALKVVSRPAAVDPGTASVPIRLSLPAGAGLAVGTPVQLLIDGEEHPNVVVVPLGAVVHEGAESAVFVAVDGKARRRVVEPGLSDGQRIEIRSGIQPGDQVITPGQPGLPDGAAIRPASAGQ